MKHSTTSFDTSIKYISNITHPECKKLNKAFNKTI